MTSLFGRLGAAHHMLTREIARERGRPAPDALRLQRLKKERLAVKDRLARHIPVTGRALRVIRALIRRLRRAHA